MDSQPMHTVPLSSLTDARVLNLTTTGHVSGQPRTIEIWFTYAQGKFYLNAERAYDAKWVRNILHQPRVHICLGGQEFDGWARILEPQQDATLWQSVCDLFRQKYGWGEGLPVEITPSVQHETSGL
jgi:deazaflavin-dependent oxidoreductase (nitroreductase family)